MTTLTPNTWREALRFVTPYAEGAVAGVIAHFGFHVSTVVSDEIVIGAGTILGLGLRALERRWPAFGALLGYIGVPQFPPTKRAASSSLIQSLQLQVAQLQAQAQEAAHPSAPSETIVASDVAPVVPVAPVA